MASLICSDWPGFKVRSRTIPLRLLRKPSTATRSAIGVTPATAAARDTALTVTLPVPFLPASRSQAFRRQRDEHNRNGETHAQSGFHD